MTRRKGLPLTDVLPEYFPYRDDGCEVSPSCLRCPLPRCKYDEPQGWLRQKARQERDRRIIRARTVEGKSIPQIARRFNLSQRTVHRVLSQNINKRGCSLKSV